MRSAEDHCLTYILDDRFPSFVDRYRSLLPDWFLEAIS
jgi:Rad3-related DNA helicase